MLFRTANYALRAVRSAAHTTSFGKLSLQQLPAKSCRTFASLPVLQNASLLSKHSLDGISNRFSLLTIKNVSSPSIISPSLAGTTQIRTVTKFSLRKGKRKTVKAVVKRFKRLHWGAWIRTRCGRHKKLWKKSLRLRIRLRQHVFVNGTQNTLLDKMVTKFWKRPKYYIDDPYTPYHTREEYFATRKKPFDY